MATSPNMLCPSCYLVQRHLDPKSAPLFDLNHQVLGWLPSFITILPPASSRSFMYPTIVAPSAFDEAISGCTHVAHIASPLVVGAKDVEKDVLVPAIQGTLSLLKSAARSSSVESVVITSSFAAVFDPAYDLRPGCTYTPLDWNPISYEQAADRNLDLTAWPARYCPFITYMASKKLAEKAAWDFYADYLGNGTSQPTWRFSVICPTYIGGPCVLPLSKGAESLSFSNQLIWNTAASKPTGSLPKVDFPHWVDV